MVSVVIFTILIIPVLFVIKRFVLTHSKQLLRVNPYIQMFLAFIILIILFAFVALFLHQSQITQMVCYILVFIVTVYGGCLFQEYYSKLSFKKINIDKE